MIRLIINNHEVLTFQDLVRIFQDGMEPSVVSSIVEYIKRGVLQKWVTQETQKEYRPINTDERNDAVLIEQFARHYLKIDNYVLQTPVTEYLDIKNVVLFLTETGFVLHFEYYIKIPVNVRFDYNICVDNEEIYNGIFELQPGTSTINQFVEKYLNNNSSIIVRVQGIPVSYQLYCCLRGKFQLSFNSVFSEGLLNITYNNKDGFIDEFGRIIIPFIYDEALAFHNNRAFVCIGNDAFFIDKKGNKRLDSPHKMAYCSRNYELCFSEGMLEDTDIDGHYVHHFPYYEIVGPFSDGLAYVMKNGLFGFVNKNGTAVIPLQFENAERFSEGLAAVKKGGHWGFVNREGELVIPCIFDDNADLIADVVEIVFKEGYAAVSLNGKLGYVNQKGVFHETPYDIIYNFSNSYAGAYASVNFGDLQEYIFINHELKEVIKGKTELLDRLSFKKGRAVVGGNTIIRKNGDVIYNCPDDYSIEQSNENNDTFVLLNNDSQARFLRLINGQQRLYIPSAPINAHDSAFSLYQNEKGQFIVERVCHESFSSDGNLALAPVLCDGELYYINQKGEKVIGGNYYNASQFFGSFAIVSVLDPYSLDLANNRCETYFGINRRGEKIFDFPYDNVDFTRLKLGNGLFPVCKNNKWGFINELGQEVIEPKYDRVENFSEGFACIENDGHWGYIDIWGNEVCPCVFDDAQPFSEGLAGVVREGTIIIFDRNFTTKFQVQGTRIYRFSEGLIRYYNSHSNIGGYLNMNGEIIFSMEEFLGGDFHCGLACVLKGGLVGIINSKGEWVEKPIFNNEFTFTDNIAIGQIGKEIYFLKIVGEAIIKKKISGFHTPNENFYISSDYSLGMARVTYYHGSETDPLYGYLDNNGWLSIPCIFSSAGPFS